MSAQNEEWPVIEVLWSEYEDPAGQKAVFGAVRRSVTRLGELDTDALARNLQGFCAQVGKAIDGARDAMSQYELSSVELSVEVTAKV